jgi:hypothetical protein
MKRFEDYNDGDLVYFKEKVYKAFKSKITPDAFKLKSSTGLKDELVDISEIKPYEMPQGLPSGHYSNETYDDFVKRMDSDFDSSGIYHVQD